MIEGPYIAEVGALIGDPARASILVALMDGRALTATELAQIAGVSPQTTSGHLSKLAGANLLAVEAQGRHRYFRLAGPRVAEALEAMTVLAVDGPPRHRPTGPRDQALRDARTCYDHLAGRIGVALADAFQDRDYIAPKDKDFTLTDRGRGFFEDFGIDVSSLESKRRSFARQCLDWSERRPHMAGALGAAVADRCFDIGWIKRVKDSRAVTITAPGRRGFAETLGIEWT